MQATPGADPPQQLREGARAVVREDVDEDVVGGGAGAACCGVPVWQRGRGAADCVDCEQVNELGRGRGREGLRGIDELDEELEMRTDIWLFEMRSN